LQSSPPAPYARLSRRPPASARLSFRLSPPLLATQGTADTINPPSLTNVFFAGAHRPKYMLSLIGAEHLPPYSTQQPQLAIVERVTLAFFDAYLKHRPGAMRRLLTGGRVAGVSALLAER
jgi:fermentation-respiration switch protein FrsA (DUF1100 family)